MHKIRISSENVLAFAWEPTANKFAFIHGESPRISVTFYIVKPAGKVEPLSKYLSVYVVFQAYADSVDPDQASVTD